jgi:hypothetical protein
MKRRFVFFLAAMICLGWLVAACGGAVSPTPTPQPDPVDRAAVEATALVQQAQATAIVLEAQAQATALVARASQTGGTATSPVPEPVVQASPTPPPTNGQSGATSAAEVADTPEADGEHGAQPAEAIPVQVTNVSFASEGGMIMISFLAPPKEADKLWPGTISVTDEGNGAVYNEIPVLPKIGPLIGRPARAGQGGYVMLMNVPPYLRPGALVTVDLGSHHFEHVPVQ